MTAIFDCRLTRTMDSLPTSISALSDPENMGIAVGISSLSCIRAEVTLFPILFRFMAVIFDFRQAQTSDSIPTSFYVLPDCENMSKSVGILLLSWLKAETNVISCLLPVLSRLVGATLVLTSQFCRPSIFMKSHKCVSVNSQRLRNGSKNWGQGENCTPPRQLMRVKWWVSVVYWWHYAIVQYDPVFDDCPLGHQLNAALNASDEWRI